MVSLRSGHYAALGLLALVPVVAYLVGRSAFAALSVVCVAVIAVSIYWMFGPAEGGDDHAAAH